VVAGAVNLTLTRFCYAPQAAFGQMVVDGTTFYSVEKPWRDNEPLISCIPEGVYKCTWEPTSTCVPDSYEHHTWYVSSTDFERGLVGYDFGVRTRVAWHIGNTADDVTGCLAFGLRLGTVGGKWAVQRSADAMALLREKLPDEFDFEIKWGMAA